METTALGRRGESLALAYLEKKGYKKITCNYKSTHGEIDLIMEDQGTLVFIEVKSRRNFSYGEPKQAVTPIKQKHIRYTARSFLYTHHITNRSLRFDVVEVLLQERDAARFHHIRNAFT